MAHERADTFPRRSETGERAQAGRAAPDARTADRLRVVAGAAGAVVGARTLESLRDALAAACRDALPFDALAVLTYDADARTLRDADTDGAPEAFPVSGTPWEQVVEGQETLRIERAENTPPDASPTARHASALAAPIRAGDEVLGALAFLSDTPGRYAEQDGTVAELAASLAAASLANLRLAGERRTADRARWLSDTRFRAVFEQLPFSMQVFDAAGKTLGVNRAWQTLFRLPIEALEHFNPLQDPQLAEVRAYLERGFAGETVTIPPHLFDAGALDPDGAEGEVPRPRWLEVTVCPVRDADGTIREVIVMHRDATEQVAAGEALRASEASYRTIFELASDAIFVHDIETGAILDANQRACALHGCTLDELKALGIGGISDGVPPFDGEHARAYVRRAAEGKPQRFEWVVRSIAGERQWVEVSLHRVRILGQDRVLASVRSIQQRKAIEEALRRAHDELEARVAARTAELAQAETRFRAIVEASPTPLLFSRLPDGVILYANDRLEDLIGVAPGSLVGRTTPDFYYDPSDRPHVLQTIQEQGYVRDFELQIKRADGTPRWVSLTVQRLVFDGAPAIASSFLDVTERKRTQEAIRASEASYRGLFDTLTELVYIQDLEGRFLNVNGAVVRAYGYTRDELIGKTPDFLGDPSLVDVEAVQRQFAEAVAGKPQRFDWWGRRKDGSVFPKEVVIQRSTYFGQDVVIAVGRDISDRVAAATALQQSEAYFRRLIENASDLISIIDPAGIIQYQSPALSRLLGYTPEELNGQNAFAYFAPEDVAPTVERLQQLAAYPGTSVSAEFRFRHKDGSWRTLEGVGTTLDPHTAEAGIVVNSRDITERKRAEVALHESEALKRGIVASALDCIISADGDGRVIEFNPAAERTFGYRADEALGRTLAELVIPPRLREAHAAGMARYQATGEARVLGQRIEVPALRADGTEFPAELAINAVRLADGREVFTAYLRDVTERKEAEEALRASETHFRRLIENASDLITIIGPDGVSRYQSPSFERILGYAPEERTGTSPFELIHPDDVPATRAILVQMLQRPGTTGTAEFRYRHKDGSWRVFEATGRTLLPDSAEAGVVINSRDVTERKEAEAALRRSEEHFRHLIENAHDMIIVVGPEGGTLRYASPSTERLLGWKPDETVGEAGVPHIHLDDLPAVAHELERLGQDPEATAHLQFRFRHRDDTWRHLEGFGKRLDPHDPAAGVVLNVRDVTERVEAERALQFQKTLLEAEGEASIDGILVISTEGEVLSFNHRFVEMWDISPEVVAMRSDEALIQAVMDRLADPEAFQARIAHLYAHSDEEARDEIALRDGQVFDRYSAPVKSREGDYYGRIWFFRDMTAQKRHAEELEAARHEAEHAWEQANEYARSLERSLVELRAAQEHLVQQEKMASLGRVTAGIAHEIKNPLNFVTNFASLSSELVGELRQAFAAQPEGGPKGAPEGALEGEAASLLDALQANAAKIEEHGRRANAIVQGMMEHARNAPEERGRRRPVDLNALVEEQVALTCEGRRIEDPDSTVVVHRDYGADAGTVVAEPEELGRVVQVLLANAFDAVEARAAGAPAGFEPTITVRTQRQGAAVTVAVADNGPGIPDAVRDRVFEPFFTTKPTGSGHPGLGLSLAHETVVAGYGGWLDVESAEGVGATFTLTLSAPS